MPCRRPVRSPQVKSVVLRFGTSQGHGFEEVAGQQDVGLGAEELCPGAGCAFGCGVDAGVGEDLPHGRGGDLHPEDEEFAVDPAIAQLGFSFARRRTRTRTDRWCAVDPGVSAADRGWGSGAPSSSSADCARPATRIRRYRRSILGCRRRVRRAMAAFAPWRIGERHCANRGATQGRMVGDPRP